MPALTNPKHERFALALITGKKSQTDAYLEAGYTAKTPGSLAANACVLIKNPKVAARIAELQEEIASSRIMSAREVLEGLSQLGRANMQDFMKIGADGQPVLDWSDLTREQAAAIQEVTVEEFTDGRSDKREVRRVKFKLAPKVNALELLGKHHKLFVDQVEHKHQHTVLHTLLKEIDGDAREIVQIEAQPDQGEDVL